MPEIMEKAKAKGVEFRRHSYFALRPGCPQQTESHCRLVSAKEIVLPVDFVISSKFGEAFSVSASPATDTCWQSHPLKDGEIKTATLASGIPDGGSCDMSWEHCVYLLPVQLKRLHGCGPVQG